jgi:hypothetical protein
LPDLSVIVVPSVFIDELEVGDRATTLRATEEWKYVDREVDIRMVR